MVKRARVWGILKAISGGMGKDFRIIFVHLSIYINSLTAMDAHERPLFDKLLWCIVTRRIFIRSQS